MFTSKHYSLVTVSCNYKYPVRNELAFIIVILFFNLQFELFKIMFRKKIGRTPKRKTNIRFGTAVDSVCFLNY